MVKSRRMNKGTIAIIVLSLLLVVSLVLSVTGAWFTAFQNRNSTTPVTFGKVSVDAGTITYSANGEVLTNFIPGDTLTISVNITDDSTVDTYIYVNTEMYLTDGTSVYKAIKLSKTEYDLVKGKTGTDLPGTVTVPEFSNVFLKDNLIDVVSVEGVTGTAAWVALPDAPHTYLMAREATTKSWEDVSVSYDVLFATDTINYVMLEKTVLNAGTGMYAVDTGDTARFSVVQLNGLTGYQVLTTLQVRAIQAEFFAGAQTNVEIEAYLADAANFSFDGQKYTAI